MHNTQVYTASVFCIFTFFNLIMAPGQPISPLVMDELKRELNRAFYTVQRESQSRHRGSALKSPTPSSGPWIGQKTLLLSLGIILPIFCIAIWASIKSSYKATVEAGIVGSIESQKILGLGQELRNNVASALLTERTLLSEALIRDRQTQRTLLDVTNKKISDLTREIESLELTMKNFPALPVNLKNSLRSWRQTQQEILEALDSGDVEKADDLYFDSTKTHRSNIEEAFSAWISKAQSHTFSNQSLALENSNKFSMILNFGFGFLVFSLLLWTFLNRKIMSAFEKFISAVRGHSYAALKEAELFGSSAEDLMRHLQTLRRILARAQETVLGQKSGKRIPRHENFQGSSKKAA